jgi:hypothetical protein
MTENCAFELAQRRTRLDAELLVEHPPCLTERRQGLGLTAASVQRKNQLATQTLTQRMARDE